MSYDVYLGTNRCPTCRRSFAETECGNYTSNCSPMWRLAITAAAGREMDLKDMEGMSGEEGIPILDGAVEFLFAPENYDKLRAMEPANGWGDFPTARDYLRGILTAWRKEPWTYLIVSC